MRCEFLNPLLDAVRLKRTAIKNQSYEAASNYRTAEKLYLEALNKTDKVIYFFIQVEILSQKSLSIKSLKTDEPFYTVALERELKVFTRPLLL